MEKRIPGSMRTRASLSELIEGRLSAPDARSGPVRLATRLIIEESLEAESRDALGRDHCERGGDPGRGLRTPRARPGPHGFHKPARLHPPLPCAPSQSRVAAV